MSANLKLEHPSQDDVPLILSILRELAEFERMDAEMTTTEDEVRESLFGERPSSEVILAYVDKTPAGLAYLCPSFSAYFGPAIYLEAVYVRPDFRGAGVGEALLKYVGNCAKERRCGRLWGIVMDWNSEAIRFYESKGARLLPDRRMVCAYRKAIERL